MKTFKQLKKELLKNKGVAFRYYLMKPYYWLLKKITDKENKAYVQGYKDGSGDRGKTVGKMWNLREDEKEKIREEVYREALRMAKQCKGYHCDTPNCDHNLNSLELVIFSISILYILNVMLWILLYL